MIITAIALKTRMYFLFEEWNEPYLQYGEVNTAEEKFILVQEALQSSSLCELAGKGGAWL
ncbi:MAG: hypothetical protein AAB914_03140 [Patescibacteria group bacterium]